MPANMCSVTEFSKKMGALKATPYFGAQMNFYSYFLHLFSNLSEFSCKRSATNDVEHF